jgi:hypothetical protein
MDRFVHAGSVLIWFVKQAFSVGGLGSTPVVIGLVVAAIVMATTLPKAGSIARKRLPYLLLLPLPWIVSGLWGGYFWREWEKHAPANPWWILSLPHAAVLIQIAISIFLLVWMRGAAALTLAFGVVNLYFALFVWLLAGMALSGDWP